MIRLVHANRLEDLAGALAEALTDPQLSSLQPIEIVVPHPTWASWLKMALARRMGIAANLRFDSLHGFLRRVVDPDPRDRPSRPSDRRIEIAGADVIETLILSILSDEARLDAPALQPVKSYVRAAGDDEDLCDLRRVQLAEQLARLFDDYLYTRRDIVRAFETGAFDTLGLERAPSPIRAIAAWQRALWIAIFGKNDRPSMPLTEAFEVLPLESLHLPSTLHVFGASRLLPAHKEILSRIGKRIDIHLYAPNPSKEFWGDAGHEGANSALRMWGRAGREGIGLVQELVGFDFEARFLEIEPSTLLGRFQADVLAAASEHVIEGTADPSITCDGSIRFLACSGVRREVEVIADSIWSLVRAYEALRFDEIAVVLAGRDEAIYRAHIEAVFAESFDLPHHLLDVPIERSSRVVEAIELLFALPFSRFLRKDLLRLLMHPSIAPHVKEAAPNEWVRWIDALAIVHGADHRDHEPTYIEKDLYNWDQGLFRLMLGAFMSGERSGDPRIFSTDAHDYLPHECALDRLSSVAELFVLVRSLIQDARRLRRTKLSLSEWAELLSFYVTTYVRAGSEEDERDLHRCLAVLADLEALDVDRRPISFRIASERAKRGIQRLSTTRGQPLAEGVVVGPLAALARIPFKVVFIAGLGEGQFPVAEKRSPLDLRGTAKRASDVSAREGEEYMFLERILATEARLHLSFVARDARTGDVLEPSPVVLEFAEILEREYLGTTLEAAGILERHPLRRYQDRDLYLRAARQERTSLALRRDLSAHLIEETDAMPEGGLIDLQILRSAVQPEQMDRIGPALGLFSLPEPAKKPVEGIETIEVPYGALRAFLEDPREGWKRFVLDLRDFDGEDDPLAQEDETFSATALDATILLREVLFEKIARDLANEPLSFEEIYDRRGHRLELKGVLPTGVFLRAERFKHLGILAAWYAHITGMFGDRPRFLDALRFGKAREHARVDAFVDPLVLDVTLEGGRRARVELYGRTEPLIDGACSLFALAKDEPKSEAIREKQALRGFLDGVVLSALGRLTSDVHRALVLFASDKRLVRTFRRFSAEDARGYLGSLVADLLTGAHAYELPCEDVFAAHASGKAIEDAVEIVARRFGPYFMRRLDDGEHA
jgi:exodeoxyribonuclease V gamma subunit